MRRLLLWVLLLSLPVLAEPPKTVQEAIDRVARCQPLFHQMLRASRAGNEPAALHMLAVWTPWVLGVDPALRPGLAFVLQACKANSAALGGTSATAVPDLQKALVQGRDLDPKLPWVRASNLTLYGDLALIGLRAHHPELVGPNLEAARQVAKPSSSESFLIDSVAAQFDLQRNPELPTSELLGRFDKAMAGLQGHTLDMDDVSYREIYRALSWWQTLFLDRRSVENKDALVKATKVVQEWVTLQMSGKLTERSLELNAASDLFDLDLGSWFQSNGDLEVSRHLLEQMDHLYATEADQYALFQKAAELEWKAPGDRLEQELAPFAAELSGRGLVFHKEDYHFLYSQGWHVWTRANLNRLWVRQLLLENDGPLAAPVQADIMKRLQASLEAQKDAEATLGYDAATDGRLAQVEVLLRVRPEGWQQQAQAVTREAVERARTLQSRGALFDALKSQSQVAEAAADFATAAASLQEALKLLETFIVEVGVNPSGAAIFRRHAQKDYDRLARLQTQLGKPEAALDALNRGAQVQVLASGSAPAELAKLKTLRGQREALEQEVTRQTSLGQDTSAASQLLAGNKQQFYAELERIRSTHPQYESLLAVRPVNFAALQKGLPEDCCVVQYLPAEQELFCFVMTRSDLKIRKYPIPAEALAGGVTSYRRLVMAQTPNQAEFDKVNEGLYKILIAPVMEDLKASSVVAFVPTGCLNYLPLAALGKDPLIRHKACVTLLKSSDLEALTRPAPARDGRLQALGDPDGSLPASGREAQEIAALFPGGKAYVKGEATRSHLADKGVRYLHLATHGVLNSRDPAASYVVLAGQDHLSLTDIYALDLADIRLVALSACQTGLGAKEGVEQGSELATLASAFSVAGGKAVVASLWSVSDDSTRELMVRFYGGVRSGKSLAVALQEAQSQLSQDPRYARPFYWAPFVLIGDWR